MFTSLLPWGPEVPRAGLVKALTETEIEIEWEPPKREFTKYILGVDPNVNTCNTRVEELKLESVKRDPGHFQTSINEHTLEEYGIQGDRKLAVNGNVSD